jgi:aromatic ring-opening dioxygenase catalytic subunit (LigB family)
LAAATLRSGTFHASPVWKDVGKALVALRGRGVLVVGNGNIVRNPCMAPLQIEGGDWAIPTNERFLPRLYVLAMQDKQEPIRR